jgi:hypothetical protein
MVDETDPLKPVHDGIERVERWIQRLCELTDDASDSMARERRRDISDFNAAALGDLAEVFEKGRSALAYSLRQQGVEEAGAKRKAGEFVADWRNGHLLIRGLAAVRHADVHLEPRVSGRVVHAFQAENDRWVLPGLTVELNNRLWPSSHLTQTDLKAFNEQLRGMTVVEALQHGVGLARDFVADLDTYMESCTPSRL